MVAPFSKIYDLRFQYFNFETDFLENENLFQKKALSLKKHHFHTKLLYEKPMLRQIEWWVQNGPITKNRVLPVTNSFFWKFLFQFKKLLQRVDLMYQPFKCPYSYFLGFYLTVLFPCILKYDTDWKNSCKKGGT